MAIENNFNKKTYCFVEGIGDTEKEAYEICAKKMKGVKEEDCSHYHKDVREVKLGSGTGYIGEITFILKSKQEEPTTCQRDSRYNLPPDIF